MYIYYTILPMYFNTVKSSEFELIVCAVIVV